MPGLKFFPMLLVLLMVSLFGELAIVLAQGGATTANINGVVKDPSGAVLVGATIKADNLNTRLTREITTQEDGSFTLTQLPPGQYDFRIQAEGFVGKRLRINLELGTNLAIEVKLELGASSNIVEITASDSISNEKTESSSNINRERIDNLPINRRNFLDFTLITPRAVNDRAPNVGVTASSGISFNGLSARFNNITIDGLDNNDRSTGTVRATFSQEAVQEFQVVSDSFSAEFGRALGGIINIVTKGGGEQYHGNLFFLNRNDSTSARDTFVQVEPEYKQYQFGGTFSGPLKRDKIFFFTSFERLSIKQNNLVSISDPIINSIRSQNFTINNGPVPLSVGTTSVLGRVDAKLGANDTLFFRYNFGGIYNGGFEPFGALVGETNGGVQRVDDDAIAVSNTYINAGLNLVNETRFLLGRRDQRLLPVTEEPQVRLFAPEGLVTFGRSTLLPQLREALTIQIADNVSLSRGSNQIKFGFDFSSTTSDKDKNLLPLFTNGLAIFQPLNFSALSGIPGLPTLSGLQAFDPTTRTAEQRSFLQALSGLLPSMQPGFPSGVPLADLSLPFAYAQGFGNAGVESSQRLFSLFFQDDIKVNQQLLIKAGLRYDISRISDTPTNNGNFSPRVSLIYRPKWLPKVNLRAAYGLFYATPIFGPSTLVNVTNVAGGVRITALPFPFSVLPFRLPGHSLPPGDTIPNGITFIPELSTRFAFQPDLRASYSQQITSGFDYNINNNTQFSVTGSFIRGIRLFSQRNINPVVRPVSGNPLAGLMTGRLIPNEGEIFEFESAYDSYYYGVTFLFNQRLTERYNLLAHYTYSKVIDNLIDSRADQQETYDPLSLIGERGLSLQDVRHRLVISGLWQLKYTNNRFLRDFELSTIINLETGKPYNLLAGVDLNGNGDNPPGDRPLGLGRNAGITPGFANMDLRLTRSISINDQMRFQLIAEIFNLFNRVNISDFNRTFFPDANGNFQLPSREDGRFIVPRQRFRNAFSPRQFQFGVRVNF